MRAIKIRGQLNERIHIKSITLLKNQEDSH
ncbi:hypothetical protein AaE_012275, partial [Aphanomyces astaci]